MTVDMREIVPAHGGAFAHVFILYYQHRDDTQQIPLTSPTFVAEVFEDGHYKITGDMTGLRGQLVESFSADSPILAGIIDPWGRLAFRATPDGDRLHFEGTLHDLDHPWVREFETLFEEIWKESI